MPDRELLKRNLFFLHSKEKKELAHDPVQLDHSQKVIDKINDMIEVGKVKDFMGMEAIYFYCMDKMKKESSNLNEYAREISDFIY